jgi:hydantoinase/carbamoylase family amidase
MNNHLQRAEKILQRINELASISGDEGCITRTYGTKAFIEGRNRIEQWMKEAGLQIRVDNIGNIRGRLLSQNTHAKTFVIASHIDTIINAGKFDGPLGVLTGLDIIEQIIHSKTELPFHIELIGFCDEEGCRFHTTYLGSKALAGSFDTLTLDIKDAAGISLREAIENIGGDINELGKDAIAKKEWAGYFEIHIEQGPLLYEKDIPVGLVTAIAGQCRAGMVFNGQAGHAGTVPMDMRKDALACAAEFILEAEKFATANKKDLVTTVGKLHIINSASNVIPGEVICSLDLRSADEATLSSSYETIKKTAEAICKKRNIVLEWNLIQQTKPVTCDIRMNKLLAQAIKEAGYQLVELVSGAGHDAVPVSAVSPVAMLFVRCFKGISHNPLENVELKDLAAAIKVSDNFIQQLIKA